MGFQVHSLFQKDKILACMANLGTENDIFLCQIHAHGMCKAMTPFLLQRAI